MSRESLYEGRFHYAGGHPRVPLFGPSSKSKVRVTEEGIEYERIGFKKEKSEFAIAAEEIQRCELRKVGGDWMSNADYFVDVTIERNGREFVVLFKAVGMTSERDASKFYTALNALLEKEGNDD